MVERAKIRIRMWKSETEEAKFRLQGCLEYDEIGQLWDREVEWVRGIGNPG